MRFYMKFWPWQPQKRHLHYPISDSLKVTVVKKVNFASQTQTSKKHKIDKSAKKILFVDLGFDSKPAQINDWDTEQAS